MARRRERICLEDGLNLSLNSLRARGVLGDGQFPCASIDWCQSGATTSSGVVMWRLFDRRGVMVLRVGALEQSISLVAAQRHFGGLQWYFLCPATKRRASVLWMPPGATRFASRQAWGRQVAYASQFQTPDYRAMSRAHSIRDRLGGEEFKAIGDFPPPKPKGMHWLTYEAHMTRLEGYEARWESYMEKSASRSR